MALKVNKKVKIDKILATGERIKKGGNITIFKASKQNKKSYEDLGLTKGVVTRQKVTKPALPTAKTMVADQLSKAKSTVAGIKSTVATSKSTAKTKMADAKKMIASKYKKGTKDWSKYMKKK